MIKIKNSAYGKGHYCVYSGANLLATACNPGCVMSYMRIGQHGEASRHLGRNLKLATPAEYAPLLRELSGIYAPEFSINPVKRLVA